jgi:hypothetical protein
MAPPVNKFLQLIPVGICVAYVGYVAQDRFADHENERSLKLVRTCTSNVVEHLVR